MPLYRKKPVVIEALKYTGENSNYIIVWTNGKAFVDPISKELKIDTLEGDHKVTLGDMVIKGVHGEFYPCKPDIFEKTYESVNDDS